MAMLTSNNNERRRSAFCAAGSGARRVFPGRVLRMRRPSAMRERIGRMVNVYKKESKQRTKPKRTIWWGKRQHQRSKSFNSMRRGHFKDDKRR